MATEKKYWVSVETLMDRTFYDDKIKLARARRNKEIEFKQTGGRNYRYNLSSVHESLFKRQLADR